MLKNAHFYHQLTKKAVILFGRLFDDITLVRKDNNTGKEIQRFLVPIIYSPKEKMVTRLFSDPDLMRQVQTILPRMGFEITGINYDSSRKQNSLLRNAKDYNSTRGASTYMGVPYDLTFQLNIYTRNIDDGTQIVEQILPFFNPDFTVTANMMPDLAILKDIPIVLNSVSNDIQYEGNFDSVRYVNWTLNFTMKMSYYGPISYPKIIREVNTNIWQDRTLVPGYISKLYLDGIPANSSFKLNDLIYQGSNYKDASAYAIVLSYDSVSGVLSIGGTQGTFKTNATIRAVSTNAYANVASFDGSPRRLIAINIKPDPITAEPTDDYGYSIVITQPSDYFKAQTPPIIYTTDTKRISVDTIIISTDIE